MSEGNRAGDGALTAVNSITVGVAIADIDDWRIEYVNRSFDEWFPRSLPEDFLFDRLIGLNVKRARSRVSKGREFVWETEVKKGARSTVLRTSLRGIDHGGSPLLIAEVVDISKHRETEHMLDSFAKLADRHKAQLEKANQALAQKSEDLQEALDLLKAQKNRMERELRVARQVQENMMPTDLSPASNECTIAAMLLPALEVGGDFFDFFYTDQDRVCFVVGDVSDKGAASGLFMAAAKTLIKTHARRAESTAEIVARVNQELARNNDVCMFVTVFLAILDTRTGEFVMTNAGHDPPYLIRSEHVEQISGRHGIPLGLRTEFEYGENMIILQPDDMVIAYTDGVTDATNERGEAFGRERLEMVLGRKDLVTPEATVRAIAKSTESFEDGTSQTDDIAVIGLKFHGG